MINIDSKDVKNKKKSIESNTYNSFFILGNNFCAQILGNNQKQTKDASQIEHVTSELYIWENTIMVTLFRPKIM